LIYPFISHRFVFRKQMEKTISNSLGIKSLLSTENLSSEQISIILNTAFYFKQLEDKGKSFVSTVRGKTIVLLFFEPSTRTRCSFEIATERLGGSSLYLSQEFSSTKKGETLYDTAKTIQAMMPDVLVLRHPCAGSPFNLDKILNIPVINAGDGFHEHPTQALLDVMTMIEFKGSLEGKKVLIVGDIAHSRVARSNIYVLKTLGAEISVCGPPTLIPPIAEKLGVIVSTDLDNAMKDKDIIILLRIQFERFRSGQIPSVAEYTKFYGLSASRLEKCKTDVLVMHPGPMNRGIELTPKVADGPGSVILEQVSNGVLMRMAILHLLTGGEPLKPQTYSRQRKFR